MYVILLDGVIDFQHQLFDHVFFLFLVYLLMLLFLIVIV